MNILSNLICGNSITQSIIIFCLVTSLGFLVGRIHCFGVRLGIAGVFLTGLLFGHLGIYINDKVLDFFRDFGLILFIYSIGTQIGPGFFSSFKRDSFKLNILAVCVVMLGVTITICLSMSGHIPLEVIVGIFSGATVNIPSLGAAQQVLNNLPNLTNESIKLSGLGFTIAYPLGFLGVILSMFVIRWIFHINIHEETINPTSVNFSHEILAAGVNIRVDNENLNDIAITNIPYFDESGVVISRVMHDGRVRVASSDTRIFAGDILYAVGPEDKLSALIAIIGSKSDIDILQIKNQITSQQIIVAKADIVGKTISDLHTQERYGITLKRVTRLEFQLPASPELKLNYDDILSAVGLEEELKEFAHEVGHLDKPTINSFIFPLIIGLILAIFIRNIPIFLLVIMIFSRIGRIERICLRLPMSVNVFLRQIGMIIFLSALGLSIGNQIMAVLFLGQGLYWMFCAALITFVPIIFVAIVSVLKFKLNYLTLYGVIAGSMTNFTTLTHAKRLSSSSLTAVAFTSVYPLAMFLRIVSVQILVFLFV